MKRSYIFIAIACTAMLASCSNGNTSDQHKDSANTLQDTFPANGLKDSMSKSSEEADATYVDSADHRKH